MKDFDTIHHYDTVAEPEAAKAQQSKATTIGQEIRSQELNTGSSSPLQASSPHSRTAGFRHESTPSEQVNRKSLPPSVPVLASLSHLPKAKPKPVQLPHSQAEQTAPSLSPLQQAGGYVYFVPPSPEEEHFAGNTGQVVSTIQIYIPGAV